MGDQVIDINEYLKGAAAGSGGAFAVWGGEEGAARFALPVWRAVYLMGGEMGGIFHQGAGPGEEPEPFFVLDLKEDPARTVIPSIPDSVLDPGEPPAVAPWPGGGVVVFLGRMGNRRWFLVVHGGEEHGILSGRRREDLLFLAGECAGLLFFRKFAEDGL